MNAPRTQAPETREPALAWRLEKVGRVDSTNDLVLKRARDGEREGLAIWAQSQRQGRGRRGRSWLSPPGCGLYFSVLLRPPLPGDHLALISLLAAVAMAEGLAEVGGLPVGVKWPNDLRLGDKKTGGILLEVESNGGRRPAVVAGVGVNLKTPPGGYPEAFAERVTSMEAVGCRLPEEGEIVGVLLDRLGYWYRELIDSGFERARRRWESLCGGIGRRAAVSVAEGRAEGTIAGIDAAGRLLLEEPGGNLLPVDSGEIIEL